MKKMIPIILGLFLLVSCSGEETKTASNSNDNGGKSHTIEELKAQNEKEKRETIEKNKKITEVIEVKEDMYVTKISEIGVDAGKTEGRIIKLEGMYYKGMPYVEASVDPNAIEEAQNNNTEVKKETKVTPGTENKNYVLRKSPGCCGDDGFVGFGFEYNGELPKENDWIEVTGELTLSEDTGEMVLKASSVKILDKRGTEFVTQ